ncbi:MAG: hypothetical protein JRJ19_15160 [Deltaproteobacteria bacterium]|nr:hypothetical protein [Deltaproteobacteria bacterium]
MLFIFLFPWVVPVMGGCAATSQMLIMEEDGKKAQGTDLWMKAVDLANRNQQWIAGKKKTRFEFQDGDHKIEQAETVWHESRPAGDGSVTTELVRATRNGEDVTEKKVKEEQERKKRQAQQADEKESPESVSEEKKSDQCESLCGSSLFGRTPEECASRADAGETHVTGQTLRWIQISPRPG